MQTGDINNGFTQAMNYGYCYLFVGLRLAPLEADMQSFGEESRQFGLPMSLQVQFPIFQQTALNLQGKARDNPTLLNGDAMDQEDWLKKVEGQAQSMTFRDICTFRLLLACVFRDLESAKQLLDDFLPFPVFNPVIARAHLRQVFAGLVAFPLSRKTKDKKYLKIARTALG